MITLESVREAERLIDGKVLQTPMIHAPALSRMFGARIYLKLENLQKTGSFKLRGATYKLMHRRDRIGSRGVVTASAGNHAQGVALAASQLGLAATIVMPEWASITKQEATRNYGGQVVIFGTSIGESLGEASRLAEENRTLIHPFDDFDIITGQATVGLELFEDLPGVDLVLVPIGGGGLIAGIASVVRRRSPETRVIGVEASVCPSASESRKRGQIIRVPSATSIADGISVKEIGAANFEIIQEAVDDIVLVEEDQIAAAMLLLLERKKILVEGAGASPLAALLNGSVKVKPGEIVVLVVSGGNVDSPLLGRIIRQGLLKNGRIMRVRVRLEDVPGALARLLVEVARMKANVLHIYHDRSVRGVPLYETHVELELETRGPDHVEAVAGELEALGYAVRLK